MSDELTFLRWFYENVGRFIDWNDVLTPQTDVFINFDEARRAYFNETGNKVPGDYKESN